MIRFGVLIDPEECRNCPECGGDGADEYGDICDACEGTGKDLDDPDGEVDGE